MIIISYDHREMSEDLIDAKDDGIIEVMVGLGFYIDKISGGLSSSWNRRSLEFRGSNREEINFLTDADAHDELHRMVGAVDFSREGDFA